MDNGRVVTETTHVPLGITSKLAIKGGLSTLILLIFGQLGEAIHFSNPAIRFSLCCFGVLLYKLQHPMSCLDDCSTGYVTACHLLLWTPSPLEAQI